MQKFVGKDAIKGFKLPRFIQDEDLAKEDCPGLKSAGGIHWPFYLALRMVLDVSYGSVRSSSPINPVYSEGSLWLP